MLRGRLWTAFVLDTDPDRPRHHQTTLNGVVGDPIGRLLREVARGMGYVRPEYFELRYVPREKESVAGSPERFFAAWDVAVPLTPNVVDLKYPLRPLTFAVKRRTMQSGRASDNSATAAPPLPPPSPQSVDALAPDGGIYGAAFWPAAADPLADLRESIANVARLCNDDSIELRAVTGALPPRPSTSLGLLPAHVVQDVWEHGVPLFPDRMPSPGQAVVARYVDVPGLLPQQRCGKCKWCMWRAPPAAVAASAPPVAEPPRPGLGAALATAARAVLGWLLVWSPDAGAGVAAADDAVVGDNNGSPGTGTGTGGGGASSLPPLRIQGDSDDGGSSRGGKVD